MSVSTSTFVPVPWHELPLLKPFGCFGGVAKPLHVVPHEMLPPPPPDNKAAVVMSATVAVEHESAGAGGAAYDNHGARRV